jgi:hypothetical protein
VSELVKQTERVLALRIVPEFSMLLMREEQTSMGPSLLEPQRLFFLPGDLSFLVKEKLGSRE